MQDHQQGMDFVGFGPHSYSLRAPTCTCDCRFGVSTSRVWGRELLINLDDVVKREVFWSRTQSMSYFVDRVPPSLAPNDCRKKPRDLKARSRRHPLQKQMTLWNAESDWKLCSIKKRRKKIDDCLNHDVLIKRLLIYWLHLARADKDRVLFLKSMHKAVILTGASVLTISNNLRMPLPLTSDIKMVDLSGKLGFSTNPPGAQTHWTHRTASRAESHHLLNLKSNGNKRG